MKKYVYHDMNRRGSIRQITYPFTNQFGENVEKYCNIYLPYGYDENDKEKKYNILYLMHGGGGNADAWLDTCQIKNMLDYSFDAGEADPFIVVFPSYYPDNFGRRGDRESNNEQQNVLFFQGELRDVLIPAVESKLNVYAESTSPEDLKAAREHRAFGGFSMGGATTWYVFLNCLDLFVNFVPMSGDCWVIEPLGGHSHPVETAAALREHVLTSGFAPTDFKIFSATGTEDAAMNNLPPQIEVMKTLTDVFTYSENFAEGNLHFYAEEGFVHAYECVFHYLYNYLPYLFK